jgi:hypothetical protein
LALIDRLPTHHGKPPPRMSQATESLFVENHEYFFNSIGQKQTLHSHLTRSLGDVRLCPRKRTSTDAASMSAGSQ